MNTGIAEPVAALRRNPSLKPPLLEEDFPLREGGWALHSFQSGLGFMVVFIS